LDDVKKEFEDLLTKDLPELNASLKSKGQPQISVPPAKVAISESELHLRSAAAPVELD
jgi:hypothetical protein